MHGDHIGGLLKDGARRFPNARVLCAVPEYEWWLARSYTPPAAEQPLRILAAYGTDLATFQFDDVVFENSEVKVKALDASGHTPGHTVFLIEPKDSQGERLLILGDLLHAAALQFPAPEACARFDMDQPKAIAARKRILDFAAQENIPVAGMHFPPPHIGTVEKNDQGGYIFRSDTPSR
jgi:glyoxylase-like metal-dependent hydrolase (beta-lactamase superfamily II)